VAGRTGARRCPGRAGTCLDRHITIGAFAAGKDSQVSSHVNDQAGGWLDQLGGEWQLRFVRSDRTGPAGRDGR